MARYVVRRLLIIPIVLIGLSILIFGMLQLLDPAERAALYVTSIPKTQRALTDIIQKYGLDKPIVIQYGNWLGRTLHGDLGWSKTAQQPVLNALMTYFPATIELALWSFIPIIAGGVWLGIEAAIHHDHWQDHLARIFSILGYSFPTFVFGLLMLLIFYAALRWFPPGRLSDWATAIVYSPQFHRYTGMMTFDALLNRQWGIFGDALRHLFLPALTLAYVQWALILRVMRSAMLDVISQDYIRTARAKGLAERIVMGRHARPNAMIPVATAGGLLLVGLLNGAVITETVFNFHGMGWFVGTAALNLDAISVLGAALFDGALLVVANLVVDIMYAYLDPRIRLQ
jgi:peptide/nickel transport system permease protein